MSIPDLIAVGVAESDRRAIGWSSGPKAADCDHARRVSGPLHVVVDAMVQDLFAMAARARAGESVKVHIKVTSGEPAGEGEDE